VIVANSAMRSLKPSLFINIKVSYTNTSDKINYYKPLTF